MRAATPLGFTVLAALLGCGNTTAPSSGDGPGPAADPTWCGIAQAERQACDGVFPERFDATTTIEQGCYVAARTPVVAAGVTVTLAPGVTVLFASRAGLRFSADQLLVAEGTAEDPICLSGQETTRGAWDGLLFDGTSAASRLDHVTVEYGGDTVTTSDRDAAGIKATADSRGVRFSLRNSTVRESQGWGLWLGGSAELSGFTSNVLTRNTLGPANVASEVVATLDDATTYTGNDRDELVASSQRIDVASSWAALDVPYYVDSNLDAGPRGPSPRARP